MATPKATNSFERGESAEKDAGGQLWELLPAEILRPSQDVGMLIVRGKLSRIRPRPRDCRGHFSSSGVMRIVISWSKRLLVACADLLLQSAILLLTYADAVNAGSTNPPEIRYQHSLRTYKPCHQYLSPGQ